MNTEPLSINPTWPKANQFRPGTWQAKGIDQETLKRKSYYGKSEYEASFKAASSMGLTMIEDKSFHSFFVGSYWPSVKTLSDNWKEQIRWAYDGYIGPKWGKVDLDQITRKEAQIWFNKLATETRTVKRKSGKLVNLKLMPSSIRRVKIVFSAILNMAVEDELITINPISKVRTQRPEEPIKRALTFYELKKFIKATPDEILTPVLFMACGMRIGESCGPQTNHLVNMFGVDGIQVCQQITQPRGGSDITKLKTPQSNRFIPLPEVWRQRLLKIERKSSIFLSSSADGGYLLPSNVYDEFAAIAIAAEIGYVTPHELRHTFISLMENELEAPAAIVSKLAGKKNKGANADYSKARVHQMAKWMEKFVSEVENAVEDQTSTFCRTEVVLQNA